MKTIQIIILLLSLVDLTATYFYVNTFHTKFPGLDYTSLEANPILRLSWKQFGLGLGMIIGGAIVFTLVFLLITNIKENWLYFFAGSLCMMIVYHMLNAIQLSNLKPQ